MIESEFPIYQIGKRVFQLDNMSNCNQEIISAIVHVLDQGGKFVPTISDNIIDSLCEIVKQSERELSILNAKLFFEKQKLRNRLENNRLDANLINDNLVTNVISNNSSKSDIFGNLKQKSH